MQKLDPYINVDPGTMSPFQHGEVYVTEDGAETDLDQADVVAVGRLVDAALDLVGDVRNHLHGGTEVIAAALLADDRLVDLAGGDRILAGQAGTDEALVMAQVQVGLGTVVGDVDLTVLEGTHGARIHVDVRIELHHGDGETARLENGGKRRRCDALP